MKRTFRKFFALSAAIMMAAIGATGDPANAYECGNTIGTYLNRYGFDIDFAPVADVNTNPENIVIGPRAFSDNPAVAAPMVTNYLQGLKDAGIVGCIKHFPGHGDTKADKAVVGCIQAGADIVLCSKDFIRAFNTIVKCVEDGAITEERINQSVRRILKLKRDS